MTSAGSPDAGPLPPPGASGPQGLNPVAVFRLMRFGETGSNLIFTYSYLKRGAGSTLVARQISLRLRSLTSPPGPSMIKRGWAHFIGQRANNDAHGGITHAHLSRDGTLFGVGSRE